jgi:hypothetical protein
MRQRYGLAAVCALAEAELAVQVLALVLSLGTCLVRQLAGFAEV